MRRTTGCYEQSCEDMTEDGAVILDVRGDLTEASHRHFIKTIMSVLKLGEENIF